MGQVSPTDPVLTPCTPSSAGFSAPVNLHYPRDDDDLAFLAMHDTDAFNAWEVYNRMDE